MALRKRVEATRAPEPDGRAAVCKTAEAGSTPAGASHRLPRRFPLAVHPHWPKTSPGRRRSRSTRDRRNDLAVPASVGIPEPLAEVILPALGEPGRLRRAA